MATWEENSRLLDSSCEICQTITVNAGKLTWSVPKDAPDALCYQCVTHQFVGYEFVVFDQGHLDEQKWQAVNDCGKLTKYSSEKDEVCKANLTGMSELWLLH